MTDYGKEFESNGYTIIKQFFTKDELATLQGAIKDAQSKVEEKSRLDKGGLLFKHNLFQRSEAVRQFISQRKIVNFLRDIVGPDIWCRWDQTVDKQPGGDEFPWHQDNGYNGLVDGHFQFWIAMSEMTKENGGLWVQKGSHRNGNLPHKLVGNHLVCPGNEADAVFVGAEAGDAALFSSFTLHRTAPNSTQKPRVAYVVEYMSMAHFDPYIEPPYFVVARDGEPKPEFVHYYRGRLNPVNQLKYFKPRFGRRISKIRGGISRWIKRNPQAAAKNAAM
jgi:ectoine hydroxylase-related dioxygenase (phytanoyl-CoA dioxygenase family)